MRRLFSLFIIAVLIFGTTTTTFAETSTPEIDITKMTKEQLDALALDVFPEYESDIKCESFDPNSAAAQSRSANQVVYTETRAVVDDLFATIVKMANGITNIVFEARGTIDDSALGSGYAFRSVTYTVTCYLSHDVMMIEDFEYTIVQNSYDAIGSLGNAWGTASNIQEVGHKLKENASGPAYAHYQGYFYIFDVSDNLAYDEMWPLIVTLTIEIGNDQSSMTLS